MEELDRPVPNLIKNWLDKPLFYEIVGLLLMFISLFLAWISFPHLASASFALISMISAICVALAFLRLPLLPRVSIPACIVNIPLIIFLRIEQPKLALASIALCALVFKLLIRRSSTIREKGG